MTTQPYREPADPEGNVISIRPKEKEVPKPPHPPWPWIVGAILSIETGVAFFFKFEPQVFVYLAVIDAVLGCVTKAATLATQHDKHKAKEEKSALKEAKAHAKWTRQIFKLVYRMTGTGLSSEQYKGKNLSECLLLDSDGNLSKAEAENIVRWTREEMNRE